AILAHRPVSVRPVTAIERFGRRLLRSREFHVAAAVLLVVAVGIGLRLWMVAAEEVQAAQREAAWREDWAGIGPTLLDAPLVMRRLADEDARQAEFARFDRMVASGVEPMPSLLARAAFRLDNGMPRAAAEDMAALAELVDSDYARALAERYRALPDAAQDSSALELPPDPIDPSPLDTWLWAFHLTRGTHEQYLRAAEIMADVDSDELGVRHLRMRLSSSTLRHLTRAERHEASRIIVDRATRVEAQFGGPTALSAMTAGLGLQMQGYAREALERYRQGIELAPTDHGLRINCGNMMASLGDLDGAIEQFAEAVRLRPMSIGARRALMVKLKEAGRYDEARRVLAETPFQETDYDRGERAWLEASIDLAESMHLNESEQFEEGQRLAERAIAAFDRCRGFGAQVSQSEYFLAKAYAGQIEDHASHLARGLTRDPTDVGAIGLLIQTLPAQLDADQTTALREYLEALRRKLAPQLDDGK
ncbi:MAG: hypothetical protein KAI24_26045, partial [Planctomycetes bacterium]|nr:hypothetical protein [Planctomycetota bacterium]